MAVIGTNAVCHMAIIVEDIETIVGNWVKIFGMETPEIFNVPPATQVPAYTDGELGDYSDCRIAVLKFDNLVLEFVQPGAGNNPWRTRLEECGGNCLQNISFVAPDSKEAFAALKEIGAPAPFHIGYYPGGTYTFIETTQQLGIPLNIKDNNNNEAIIEYLLAHPEKKLTDKEITEGIEF